VDNGNEIKKFLLKAGDAQGIFITTEWHTMIECSRDCIILVIANAYCDENDYIRDYKTWKEWIHGYTDPL
jgi:hypothetical protein